MKNLFLSCFLLFCGFCTAQTSGRVELQGEILVPQGFEAEGITIYNQNSNRGTVSAEKGHFSIHVKEGDSLSFSAVQFSHLLVVVDREMIQTDKLVVEIFEGVNELPEIVIRPHNLSGVLGEDTKKIEVVEIKSSAFNYEAVKNLHFPDDSQTVPTNAAIGETMAPTSIDFLKIFSSIIGLFSKGEEANAEKQIKYFFIDRELRKRYSEEFFNSTFAIESRDINEFISFAEDNGLDGRLMSKENEMDLLQFLVEQSIDYKKRKAGEE